MLILGALLAGYVGYRFLQRWLFLRSLKAARISVQELHDMMRRGDRPVVLDVRTRIHRRLDGRQIPGAHAVDLDELRRTLADEATAAKVALQLRGGGFRRVRPLAGGIDAWAAAGFAVDRVGRT